MLKQSMYEHIVYLQKQSHLIGLLLTISFLSLSACTEEAKPNQASTLSMPTVIPEVDMSIPTSLAPDMISNQPAVDLFIVDQLLVDNVVDALPIANPPLVPTKINTLLTESLLENAQTPVSIPITVQCLVLDQYGQPMPEESSQAKIKIRPSTWVSIPPSTQSFSSTQTGSYQVSCELLTQGLLDDTPAQWEVTPGPARYSEVLVSQNIITAGESFAVQCLLYDEYLNPINLQNESITWSLNPTTNRLFMLDQSLSIETAGLYHISCSTPTVTDISDESFEIVPAAASSILSALEPSQPAYQIGEVIHWKVQVLDQFGNEINAPTLTYDVPDGLSYFGDERLIGQEAGTYQATVTVNDGIEREMPLTASITVLIDDGLPTIRCISPALSYMGTIQQTTITGQVNDISGISRASIDGEVIEIDDQGRFSKVINPSWGINVYPINAVDRLGNESSTFCAFFAANRYHSEGTTMADAAILHLDQSAIDDGAPASPLRSLTDIIRGMINSRGLVNTVDTMLRSMNPLYNQCVVNTFFGCATSANITYTGMSIGSNNTVTATLVNGGIQMTVVLNNLVFNARARGSVIGIPLDETGSVALSRMTIGITFDVRLVNGQPQVSVRGTPSVSIGNITVNFDSAILGTVLEVVSTLFEGLIRDQVTNSIKSYLSTEVDSILTNVLRSIDLSSIALNLNIPNPANGGNINLSLAFSINRLDLSAQRMRMTLSSRVTGSRAQNRASAGIALPSQEALIELNPGANKNTSGAAFVGFLNACLHQIWRSGLFEINQQSPVLSALSASGVRLSFGVVVPPAIELLNSNQGIQARIHIGPATGSFFYPGYFETSLNARFTMTALANISIDQRQTLRFGGLTIESFHFALDEFALSEQSRAVIEEDLKNIMQSLLDTALNEALPAFPIPDFALPNSLNAYGVPLNTRLGIKQVVLEKNGAHLQIKGVFMP